jgi:hypothetical protein
MGSHKDEVAASQAVIRRVVAGSYSHNCKLSRIQRRDQKGGDKPHLLRHA